MQNGSARFLPDGQRIFVNGNEPERPARGYVQDLSGGKPRPITPAGVVAFLASPDSKYVAGAAGVDRKLTLYPIDGGEPRPVSGLEAGYIPIQWSGDGSALYVFHLGELPTRIFRVEIASGKRQLVRELVPADRAGVVYIGPIVMNREASRFVYSDYQVFSVLYVTSGLQ